MHYVYVLLSTKNKDLYVGRTENLRNRIETHNAGKVRSTKPNRPWRLVYFEAYLSKKDSTQREYQLKKSSYYKEELTKRLQHSLKFKDMVA